MYEFDKLVLRSLVIFFLNLSCVQLINIFGFALIFIVGNVIPWRILALIDNFFTACIMLCWSVF